MKTRSKLILKGISKDSGQPFIKEIHTLNEVKTTGDYVVIGRNISISNGLPPINGKQENCFCCECLLIVTCCYSDDESQSSTTYGQKLIISDRETGTTNTFTRTITPHKNDGEWSEWQMSATGDIELISQNNDIIERISNLVNQISAECNRAIAKETEIENKFLKEIPILRFFDTIEENESTINAGQIDVLSKIVYYKPANKFVAADNAGDYWDTWDGMDAYMSNGVIREDKIYICSNKLYTYNGGCLSNIYAELDELVKSHNSDIIDLNYCTKKEVYCELTSTGYYPCNGNIEDFYSGGDFKSTLIDVRPNDIIEYSVLLGGSSMAALVLFDNNGKNVGHYLQGDSSYNIIYKGTYVVPQGVSQIGFSSSSFYSDEFKDVYLKKTGDRYVIKSIDNRLGVLENFTETRSKNLWNGKTIDGIISFAGTITTNDSYAIQKTTELIPVKPNTYYYLSGRNGDQNTIRTLNTNGEPSQVLAAETGLPVGEYYNLPRWDGGPDTNVLNGQFMTNSDAAFVQITLAKNAGEYNQVMLEEVGEIYIKDFRPSSYEPYNLIDCIKEDKLPNTDKYDRKPKLKILLIGSSHGMNTISQLPWIAHKSGFDIVVGNIYKGSLSLEEIASSIQNSENIGGWFKVFSQGSFEKVYDGETWNGYNTMFDYAVTYQNWDFIIFQRSASEDETWTENQSLALDIILKRLQNVCNNAPTILFNSGFADTSTDSETQKQVTSTIMDTAKAMREEFGLELIPTAVAIQKARETSLKELGRGLNKQLCYDSQHLDFGIGCYVASATVFEFIYKRFGYSIIATNGYGTYDEVKSFAETLIDNGGNDAGQGYTEPTLETITIAKRCAMAAVNNNYI